MVPTTILFLISSISVFAIPVIPPINVSPGIDLPGGPGRFGQASRTNERRSFTAHALPNPLYRPSGKRSLRRTLTKYALPMPPSIRRDIILEKRAGGSVVATPGDLDVQYVCPVTIGDKQSFNLNFDTGSSDLWVFSSYLPKAQQDHHEIYTPGATAQALKNSTWGIEYGDGSSASGVVIMDSVAVGGTIVKSQAVGAANSISTSFGNDTFADGLLGLGFGNINTVKPVPQKTFLENAIADKQLAAGVLTADLYHQKPGSYEFGAIDAKKYTGDVLYTPVDSSKGFWEFPAESYKIGNKTFADEAGTTAIADTGTTLLLMSSKAAKNYYSKVKGAKLDKTEGGWTFPCAARLPDLEVSVGMHRAFVPGDLIKFTPTNPGGKVCFGGLQGYEGNMYIYGDIFLKAVFGVFDMDNKKFGFAAKAR